MSLILLRIKSVSVKEVNVLGYFNIYPRVSIRLASWDLDICYIVRYKNWHLFKFIRLNKLRPEAFISRIHFCDKFQLKIQNNKNSGKELYGQTKQSFFDRELSIERNQQFGHKKIHKLFRK